MHLRPTSSSPSTQLDRTKAHHLLQSHSLSSSYKPIMEAHKSYREFYSTPSDIGYSSASLAHHGIAHESKNSMNRSNAHSLLNDSAGALRPSHTHSTGGSFSPYTSRDVKRRLELNESSRYMTSSGLNTSTGLASSNRIYPPHSSAYSPSRTGTQPHQHHQYQHHQSSLPTRSSIRELLSRSALQYGGNNHAHAGANTNTSINQANSSFTSTQSHHNNQSLNQSHQYTLPRHLTINYTRGGGSSSTTSKDRAGQTIHHPSTAARHTFHQNTNNSNYNSSSNSAGGHHSAVVSPQMSRPPRPSSILSSSHYPSQEPTPSSSSALVASQYPSIVTPQGQTMQVCIHV